MQSKRCDGFLCPSIRSLSRREASLVRPDGSWGPRPAPSGELLRALQACGFFSLFDHLTVPSCHEGSPFVSRDFCLHRVFQHLKIIPASLIRARPADDTLVFPYLGFHSFPHVFCVKCLL